MIFVTVGTHEQPFNRLIKQIDQLVETGKIKDDVIVQIGYSTYFPKFCSFKKFFSYYEMEDLFNRANIIITHGGPSSFIYPLSIGKKPIVVPRRQKYKEHVNDHQFFFCNELVKRGFPIILIDDERKISDCIDDYQNVKIMFKSNNNNFTELLEKNLYEDFKK